MQLIKELTRDEMKQIMAGSIQCRVAYRKDDEHDTWIGYGGCYSESDADDMYLSGDTYLIANNGEMHHDAYVSGYCCTSCGGPEFPNAIPCAA